MKFFPFAYILAFSAMVSSCGTQEPSPSASDSQNEKTTEKAREVSLTEAQMKVAGVQLGPVEKRPMSGLLHANGLLDIPPQNNAVVAAPFGGFLKHTDLLQGMRISRGQVVATLEDPNFVSLQQEYLENKAQLAYLQAEAKRQEDMMAEQATSQRDVELARSQFESAKMRVSGLRTKLEMMNVDLKKLEEGQYQKVLPLYSPISGFVSEVHATIGAFVQPSDRLFTLVDTEHLHAELQVYERDLPKIALGQKVRVTLANESAERIATVYLVGKSISEDRSVRVHCHFEKEDPSLVPGQFLKATIETTLQETPALPEEAVVEHEGQFWVFATVAGQNNRFKAIPVHKGLTQNGFVEVSRADGGDFLGQQVVIQGAYDVLGVMFNQAEE